MATLYRKYRPQNFKEVVGQNHIKLTLEHEIESGKLAHAYIFCGPRAIGKTTLARVLSKSVNCTNRKEGEYEPCDKCDSCKDIVAGKNLDIIEVDAASHTGVDNVRENIIAQARVVPSRAKYKVFIIDEVHMLSASAFNALLKVLEEPPTNVLFILCTTEIHKVPTTIISRCQRFDFKRISVSDVVQKLSYIVKTEKIKIDKVILETIARQSEGHMRDAESLLGQIISVGGKEITKEEADLVIPRSDLEEVIKLLDSLSKKDAKSGLTLVNRLVDEGVDLKTFLNDLIEISRKMMFAKITPNLSEQLGLEIGENFEIKISKISKNLELDNLVNFIEQFIRAKGELKGSFIFQLPIEMAIIRICSGARSIPQSPVTPGPVRQNTGFMGVKKQENNMNSGALKSVILDSLTPKPVVKNNINQGEIGEKWHEVLARVKKYNHSLSFILRVCEPRGLDGNNLCLAFKYKFHKDRVGDEKIRTIIEKVLVEVYGFPLMVSAIVDENLEIGNQEVVAKEDIIAGEGIENKSDKDEGSKQSNIIDNLLKTFGGKIIN